MFVISFTILLHVTPMAMAAAVIFYISLLHAFFTKCRPSPGLPCEASRCPAVRVELSFSFTSVAL